MKTQMDNLATALSPEALEDRVATLQQKLSDSGHRTTPQRINILRALLTTETHPTAEEIWDRVRSVSPTTTLATVYKTLDTLKELGEVMELDTRDDSRHYDGLHPDPHPHAVCKRCGRIDDVDLDGLDTLQSQATKASGYRIEEQDVTFYGLCARCQQEE
ncbi:transcriptional repressor [Capsulimonas corticalis]|uniref:Transcriptional repressor n=1 Tax=Capsulimonas corticalis TaxID=2219043 RepID=A0A402CS36_9BACT|nr:transcriptional repressor [Capsulimonas corticalis]BDI28250.1 transcriptional repressor [Capsulimonas corticalis]